MSYQVNETIYASPSDSVWWRVETLERMGAYHVEMEQIAYFKEDAELFKEEEKYWK